MLINGAGGNKKEATTGPDMSFFDIPEDAMRFVFDLNLIGTVMPSQVFGRLMAEAKSGCILNTASVAARVMPELVVPVASLGSHTWMLPQPMPTFALA